MSKIAAARQGPGLDEIIAERVAAQVTALLVTHLAALTLPAAPVSEAQAPQLGWRVLLWMVPAETRLNKKELLEALDKRKSWLYARTSKDCPEGDRIPHRRDGESNDLAFLAGEIREWVRSREVIEVPGSLAIEELYRENPNLSVVK